MAPRLLGSVCCPLALALVLTMLGASADALVLTRIAPAPSTRTSRSAPPLMAAVRKVTTAEFEEELQDCSTPILLDVFAVWCGPCQLMAPQLEQVAEKLGDKVRVLKVDADEEPEVADTLMIRGLPTVLLINDMSVVMRAEGALMADELLEIVNYHFFGGPKPKSMEPTARQ